MIRSVVLPLLPGNSFRNNIGQTRFHKSQHFEHLNSVTILTEKLKPGIEGAPLPWSRPSKYPSIYARAEAPELPAWIVFDKQVLCFDAYFQETVQEQRYTHLVRKCKIYFYLEDGTVQVVEPKVANSGIPQDLFIKTLKTFLSTASYYTIGLPHRRQSSLSQEFLLDHATTEVGLIRVVSKYGETRTVVSAASVLTVTLTPRPSGTLISRQRIPFPAPRDSDFYDMIDFNVDREVELFGRVFKITDCDRFTRVFLNRMGIAVPDPVNVPPDPYSVERDKVSGIRLRSDDFLLADRMLAKHPNNAVDTLRQFLVHDRQVLRFYGYWDDRESPHGLLHNLEIYYYLSDDTMEIKEVIPPNSGRDAGYMFMRRAKLRKTYTSLPQPGWDSRFTVLNVISSGFVKGRYISDPLNCGQERAEYYKDSDLTLGAVINVFGRQVMITDCDPFTKEYFRAKYGLDDFTAAERPLSADQVQRTKPPPPSLPPYNGFGTYEDSAANCRNMIPVPPNRDFAKFLQKDRQGLDSHILRFRAEMLGGSPADHSRHFVISYYLSDDTIAVFEQPRANTGFHCGSFISRRKIFRPNQDLFGSEAPECYNHEDFYIGNILELHRFRFRLVDADEYALRYMELNSQEFPKSNIRLILLKLREVLRPMYKQFVCDYLRTQPRWDQGLISYSNMKEVLRRILCGNITDQEILTLGRHYNARSPSDKHTRAMLRSIVHTELTRYLFKDLDRLQENLLHKDPERKGYLPRGAIYSLCRASLPVDRDLLNAVLDTIDKNEACEYNYNDLLSFLDSKVCPAPAALPINTKVTISQPTRFGGRMVKRVTLMLDYGEVQYEFSLMAESTDNRVTWVDFTRLLKDLDLESTVTEQSG
uniref:DM10 domain-containing protein n=1 Tax=Timema poppense TaxID=170557 RepID=A0A7R9D966_TIMPO|nr:unnamed protein product [Timema poppensis]